MAKFKIGDKVVDSTGVVYTVGKVEVVDGEERVWFKGYGNTPPALGRLAKDLRLARPGESANARACNGVRSRNSVVAKALNACGTARNAGAYDVAAQAGKLFKDAYNDLAGCAANLERLTTLGQPDDVPGNDNKIAAWAKDKARKVRDIMNKLDQGRL